MGKRKRSNKDDDDDTVKNLLKQVKKLVNKRRRISSESSDENSIVPTTLLSPVQSPPDLTSDQEPDWSETPVVEPPLEGEPELDPEILELLGTDPTQDKKFGDSLRKDLATRWQHILVNGLPKDEKTDLLKKYLPAANCPNMRPPKLNPEVKSAITEINCKKDSYSEQKQNQMCSCLSAIGKAINLVMSQTGEVEKELIKSLSDAGRLLCDTYYRESLARRYSIISSISKNKREVIKNTKIDEYLFGSDLSDHLKSSKAISKSASELKYTNSAKYQTPPAWPSTSMPRRQEALNTWGAPRMPAARAGAVQRVNPAPPPPRRQAPLAQAPQPPRGRREPNHSSSNYRQQNRRR